MLFLSIIASKRSAKRVFRDTGVGIHVSPVLYGLLSAGRSLRLKAQIKKLYSLVNPFLCRGLNLGWI